jgi:hypothetical protein
MSAKRDIASAKCCDLLIIQKHSNLSMLFAVCLPQLEAHPLTFHACLWRSREKKQSSVMVSMDRFTIEHQVFLYGCYVKCVSGIARDNLVGSNQDSSFSQECCSVSCKENLNKLHIN